MYRFYKYTTLFSLLFISLYIAFNVYKKNKLETLNQYLEVSFDFEQVYIGDKPCSSQLLKNIHNWAIYSFMYTDKDPILIMMTSNYAIAVIIEVGSKNNLEIVNIIEPCIKEIIYRRIGIYDIESDNKINATLGDKEVPPIPIIFQTRYVEASSEKVTIAACFNPLKSILQ